MAIPALLDSVPAWLVDGPAGSDGILWLWYIIMLLVTGFNLLFFAWVAARPQPEPSAQAYRKKMALLAIPMVFQCSWRSLFPNQYAQRIVFWDVPFSSILLARCFACVGELAWVAQVRVCACVCFRPSPVLFVCARAARVCLICEGGRDEPACIRRARNNGSHAPSPSARGATSLPTPTLHLDRAQISSALRRISSDLRDAAQSRAAAANAPATEFRPLFAHAVSLTLALVPLLLIALAEVCRRNQLCRRDPFTKEWQRGVAEGRPPDRSRDDQRCARRRLARAASVVGVGRHDTFAAWAVARVRPVAPRLLGVRAEACLALREGPPRDGRRAPPRPRSHEK